MPDNAANRKSIRRKEKEAKLADTQRREVISQLMGTTAGRHWIWDILSSCHCFATTFNGEALTSAFAEGERNVGLRLLADVMIACPEQYIQAQREANERENLNEVRSQAEEEADEDQTV